MDKQLLWSISELVIRQMIILQKQYVISSSLSYLDIFGFLLWYELKWFFVNFYNGIIAGFITHSYHRNGEQGFWWKSHLLSSAPQSPTIWLEQRRFNKNWQNQMSWKGFSSLCHKLFGKINDSHFFHYILYLICDCHSLLPW